MKTTTDTKHFHFVATAVDVRNASENTRTNLHFTTPDGDIVTIYLPADPDLEMRLQLESNR